MSTSLLICDDSNLARKQLAKCLPSNFNMDIHFATNGVEAIAALQKGVGDIMFLDLNMPEMDGYEVLQAIRDQNLNSMVIVVSGDIQPEARTRVKALGAVEFIKKPIDVELLINILFDYGIIDEIIIEDKISSSESSKITTSKNGLKSPVTGMNFHVDFRDCYQEITNVGMGQAADLLAKMLGVFVSLPVPNVNIIEVSEIHMALTIAEDEKASAICQGFIGRGIAGEAILLFNDAGIENIAHLMHYDGEINDTSQSELLMDISNILIGTCLKGIGSQLNINFSQGNPLILGQHKKVSSMIKANAERWNKTLAIEVDYTISNANINCDLLLLFTEDSLDTLNRHVSYLVDE